MQMSRRRVLQLGLLGSLGALALGVPVLRSAGREAELLSLVTQALFLPGEDPDSHGLPDAFEVDAGVHAWAFVQHMPAPVRWQLSGLLRALEHGARLRTGRPFSALSVEERHGLLVGLANSRARTPRLALSALKQVCAMGLLRHPRAWAALGYDGPTLLRIPPGAPGVP